MSKAPDPNIELVYTYTSSDHTKTTGELVFANPEALSLGEIEYQLKSRLIGLEYFHHSDFMVPALFGEYPDLDVNPTLHAFVRVVTTNKEATDKRTISDFIANLK